MTKIGVGVAQAFGAIGCLFGTRTAVTVGVSTSVLIPPGWWLCENDAHTTVRVKVDNGSTYVTLLAASAVGFIWSDGLLVEFRGDGTGGTGTRSAVLGAN